MPVNVKFLGMKSKRGRDIVSNFFDKEIDLMKEEPRMTRMKRILTNLCPPSLSVSAAGGFVFSKIWTVTVENEARFFLEPGIQDIAHHYGATVLVVLSRRDF